MEKARNVAIVIVALGLLVVTIYSQMDHPTKDSSKKSSKTSGGGYGGSSGGGGYGGSQGGGYGGGAKTGGYK